MPVFASDAELDTFAEQLLRPRLDALEKDTQHCLTLPYAPFPAILLCFSTIDLIGALAGGDASRNAPTTQQSSAYMRDFMNYSADQAALLQALFRHKLVHLAQPKPVVSNSGKTITWRYWHDDVTKHLQLTPLAQPQTLMISAGLSVTMDHEFGVSIVHLVKDVTESVRRPGGYLARLKTDLTLRAHFETAISQIYGP